MPFLDSLLSQTRELRRDPKEKEQERRAKASAALNDWLGSTDLSEIAIVTDDEDGRILTLEQINNFQF